MFVKEKWVTLVLGTRGRINKSNATLSVSIFVLIQLEMFWIAVECFYF